MLHMVLPLVVGVLLPPVFWVLVRTPDLYASGLFSSVPVAFGGLATLGGACFLNNEKQREALARRIDKWRAQMDRLRRAVGVYCMSYVRSIIPPEAFNVFASLSKAVDKAERARAAQRHWVWSPRRQAKRFQSANRQRRGQHFRDSTHSPISPSYVICHPD